MATNQEDIPISVGLTLNFQPPIFDFSGTVPFEVYVNAGRSVVYEQDPRDLVILITGSIFDLPAALRDGRLELVEVEDNNGNKKDIPVSIPFHNNSNSNRDSIQVDEETQTQTQTQAGTTTSQLLSLSSFITLPPDGHGKPQNVQRVPLHGAASALCEAVQPGHKYRLQLRGKDLGVKWWGWGSSSTPEIKTGFHNTELLPPMPQRLVSGRSSCFRQFAVLSSVELAPRLSIALSLSREPEPELESDGNDIENDRTETETETEAETKEREIVIQITITNNNGHSITVKTRRHHPLLLKTGEISNPMPRITDACPSIRDFSFIDQETHKELMSDGPIFVSPVAGGGGQGWARREFLTLAPKEQVIRTVKFPEQFLTRVCTRGRKYRVGLRRTGCWWANGTLDDLFGEGNEVLKSRPLGVKVPMELESDDSVIFRY